LSIPTHEPAAPGSFRQGAVTVSVFVIAVVL